MTRNGDNISVSKSVIKAGALNVAVTDEVLTDQGKSGRNGTTAVSFVAPNGTDLPHEMAHQFTGDTNPGIVNGILSKDPTGFLLGLSDTYADFSNDFERAWMRNLDQHSGVMSHYPFASVFNHDAAVFQNQFSRPRSRNEIDCRQSHRGYSNNLALVPRHVLGDIHWVHG